MTTKTTATPVPTDPDAFLRAVTARFSLATPSMADDADATDDEDLLDPGDRPVRADPPPKPAAVLIPVVARAEATVLLTQRSGALSSHAGQISFPGGRIDAGDTTPIDTALREAEEEIGLARHLVRPLGYMPPFLSRTGYRIVPVVSLVQPGFELTLNASEVTDAFEVPLAFLMDPANHQYQSREWQGRRRWFYAMPYGDRYIWGITAGILRNLWERLSEPALPPTQE